MTTAVGVRPRPGPASRRFARPVTDSATMLRRRVRHLWRYPSLTLMLVGQPIVFLLLFVYVFGATLGAGLGGDRATYLAYVTPAILLMTVASVALGTAIGVATDMTEGIVARFRTMAVARVSLLFGHVAGAMVQTVLAVGVVLAVALLLGFRTGAGPLGWLAVAGVLAMITYALTWFTVALGLAARTVESASNTPMFLVLLPFLGSGFVPTASMPAGLRFFAEYQPLTPMIETVRALLAGSPPGSSLTVAIAWCAVIAVGSHLVSRRLFETRGPR